MDIEKLIMDTFTEHEHDVPDGDSVYAAARQRIDRGRRVLSPPLAVAAGVIVLTLAAVTFVLVNRSGPADKAQVAAPTNQAPASTSATEPAMAGLPMPYSLGWLPDGKVEYLARRINTGATAEEPDKPVYNGEYMLNVTAGGQVIDIDVQEMKQSPADDAAFKSGPGASVTIAGRHGVESSVSDGPGGYELYLTHPQAGSIYVNVSASAEHGSTVPAQQLIEIGRKVAENVQFPGTTTVTPAFGLGALPNGVKLCAWDVEKGFDTPTEPAGLNTSYELGACTSVRDNLNVGITNKNGPRGTAGQPVQGHETRVIDEGGYTSLWILDAIGDTPILVAGKVPQTELYAIANGLVLPH